MLFSLFRILALIVERQNEANELQFHPGPARKLSTNLYDIYHCWVYSEWTPDDAERNCPKHVVFHAKINLWN